MHISKKELENSQVELTITLEAGAMEKYKDKAMIALRSKVSLPGFRPGKAPDAVIFQEYGENVAKPYMLEEAVDDTLQEAVKKEDLAILGPASGFEMITEEPLSYKVVFEVFPDPKLNDAYKSIKIKKEKVIVNADDVDTVVNQMLKDRATYVSDDKHKVTTGDKVTMSFSGKEKESDTLIEGAQAESYTVEIGSKSLIEGFEDSLMGMIVGEEKDFEVTFPKDYFQETLRGKKAIFHVHVKKVEKVVTPELTEELIKQIRGEDMSIAAFKDEVKKTVTEEREKQAENKRREEFVKEALEKSLELGVPASMVEKELDQMIENFEKSLEWRGMKLHDYLAQAGSTLEHMRKEWYEEALRRIKASFLMRELLKKEDIKITDEDVAKTIAEKQNKLTEEKHKDFYKNFYEKHPEEKERLKEQVLLDLLFTRLLD